MAAGKSSEQYNNIEQYKSNMYKLSCGEKLKCTLRQFERSLSVFIF